MKINKLLLFILVTLIGGMIIFSVIVLNGNRSFVSALIMTSSLTGVTLRQLYENKKGKTTTWDQITVNDKIIFFIGNVFTLGCIIILAILGYGEWQVLLVFIAIFIIQWILYYFLGSQIFRRIILPKTKE